MSPKSVMPDCAHDIAGKDYAVCLQVLAKAADALSAGDLVNRKVRQYGSWGLMPFAAAIGSVYPATYMRGNRETYHPMENNWPRCAGLHLITSVFLS